MLMEPPQTPRKMARVTATQTPKSIRKRTILDPNSSYIETDDATYIYGGSSDDDDNLESSILEEDADESTDVEEEAAAKVASDETIISEEVAELSDKHSALRKFIVKHEVIRKVFHSSIGVFTLWLYTLGVHQQQLLAPLLAIFAVIFVNDYMRFRNPELNAKIVSMFWFVIRPSEVHQYNGVLWYLIGLVLVFAVAPKDISLMSVLLLSWADTAASTFGRQFGKYTPRFANGKSLAGSIASGVTGVLSCYMLYSYFIPAYNDQVNVPGDILWTPESSKLNLHVYALLAGVIASVSEFIDIYGLDDNFTIPVMSGAFLLGLVNWFHV